MAEEGLGAKRDLSKAFAHYRKAANKGCSWAQTRLALSYQRGIGTKRNYKKAVEWYSKAAAQGDAVAQSGLGFLYQVGRGVTEKPQEAFNLYKKGADQGYADIQYMLARAYDQGFGTEKDPEKALKWYRKSADSRYAPAQDRLRELEAELQTAAIPQSKTKLPSPNKTQLRRDRRAHIEDRYKNLFERALVRMERLHDPHLRARMAQNYLARLGHMKSKLDTRDFQALFDRFNTQAKQNGNVTKRDATTKRIETRNQNGPRVQETEKKIMKDRLKLQNKHDKCRARSKENAEKFRKVVANIESRLEKAKKAGVGEAAIKRMEKQLERARSLLKRIEQTNAR